MPSKGTTLALLSWVRHRQVVARVDSLFKSFFLSSPNTHVLPPGRRVLETYLQLFLHSTPGLQAISSPDYDFDNITARALNTYVLGEHVAPQWRLPDIMRWRPVANDGLKTNDMRSIGLYKVSGTMVESVMGGLFHQFVRRLQSLSFSSARLNIFMKYPLGRLRDPPRLPYPRTTPHPPPQPARRPTLRIPRSRERRLS